MRRVELKHISIRPRNPWAGLQKSLHWIVLSAFAAAVLLELDELMGPIRLFATAQKLDCLLLCLATASTAVSLMPQLPAQNVILAVCVVGAAGGGAQLMSAVAAVPFGPIVYNPESAGRFLVYPMPWSVPLIWIIILLNSRGVARLMLRSRRRAAYYGFWVIGFAAVLVVVFDLSLEPYATQIRQFWSWKPTKIHSDWYGTPWINFIGCAVISTLILLFVTPALINKSPRSPPPPSFHPLIVWELLSVLFAAGARIHHLQAAFAFTLCQMLLVGVVSLIGGRTGSRPRCEAPAQQDP